MKEKGVEIYNNTWAKIRTEKPGPALLKQVLNASKIEDFEEDLENLYPTRNALSATSFRNANNVTDLAKMPRSVPENGWFITAYENHRFRNLNRVSNQKLLAMTIEKLADALSDSETISEEDVKKASALLAEAGDVRSKDFYGKLQTQFKSASKWSAGDVKKVFASDLQGISALKRERQEHYSSQLKKSQQWKAAEDDNSIFVRAIGDQLIDKKRMPAIFHGEKGHINANVMSSDLVL